jgi:hypothetical protein
MYLRTTKVKRPDGTVDEYIRLVESYWNDGSPRHRVICNLGHKDLLAPHAHALLQLLKGEEKRRLPTTRRWPSELGTGESCWWRGISGKS